MDLVPISFKCNMKKYVLATFQEQLDGHETGLNAISVPDWIQNRKDYLKSGRGSNVPQEEVRELYRKQLKNDNPTWSNTQIEKELALLAALHEPDLVAGGFNVIGKLGSRYINSSIGSQWRTNVDVLEEAVENIRPKEDKKKRRINVKLTAVKFTPP
jgi:Novel toxin 15